MTQEEALAQEKKDQEELAADQAKRDQWQKDNPGRPYVTRLSPRLQALREAEAQEHLRAQRQAQADQNNQDQERLHSKAIAREQAAQTEARKELDDEDAAKGKEKPAEVKASAPKAPAPKHG